MKDPILSVIELLFEIYFYVLIARVILTYMTSNIQMHPISIFILKITDPLLTRLRRIIPDQTIGTVRIDVSLILLILFYKFFTNLIIGLLSHLLY